MVQKRETGLAADLHDARYVSVTTYRRDGTPVATPVEVVIENGGVYFRTLVSSGKVKRIRRNPLVGLAPCTMRGKLTGQQVNGIARLLSEGETEALQPVFDRKYGFLLRLIMKLRAPRTQGVRLDLR